MPTSYRSWFAVGVGTRAAIISLALRGMLVFAVFGLFHSSWSRYLSTSDAGSFVAVARTLAGLAPAEHLTVYDTRVFPGWPLLLAPVFALGLPEQTALALALFFAALAPWLYERLTHNEPSTWLLVAFPPAWLLATVHPISEAAYFCLAVAGCLALRSGAWFWTGVTAGSLVVMRPFGLAWVLAFACVLPRDPQPGRSTVRYLTGGALMALLFAAANLHLYSDLFQQLRVYAKPLSELNLAGHPAGASAGSGHWGWPFVHLVATPFHFSVPTWKIGYIFGTVVLFLALLVTAVIRLRRATSLPGWERAALLGFIINSGLSFCTGPYWAFHSVDRYLLWGLPGALIAAQPWLRRWPSLGWLLNLAGACLTAFSIWNRFYREMLPL